MKISQDMVIQAIRNIANSEASNINMFWGMLSLFASANKNSINIHPQETYSVSQNEVGRLLTDWFSYRENEKSDDNVEREIYFILSREWSIKLAELMKIGLKDEEKLSVLDFSIFFSKNMEFEESSISKSRIVNNFISKIGISATDLNDIFDMSFKDEDINLVNNYDKHQFFLKFKEEFSIDSDNTTLSFDKSGTTIASHPKELSRAPFIQTLYSGMSIQNIILVSNSNLSLAYKFGAQSNDIQKEAEHTHTIYYGAPGTGKSHTINKILENVPQNNKETVTFHPEYDYASFVGGYRPITETDSNGNESIKYKFVPQVFTNLYVKAWQNQNEQFYLTIEEINRGNCAEIFGDIFQLLDQNQSYTVTPSSELKAYLVNKLSDTHKGIKDGLKMPNNLTIMATMNTSDQSLFPMDSAFKRRWDWEYMPINYERDASNPSSEFKVYLDDDNYFYWLGFIEKVNAEIKRNPSLGMDKCIGNYFIKPESGRITLKTFINKAIFYLWNDVFKDEFGNESIFDENTTYEDFFPIEAKGIKQVQTLLNNLKVEIHQNYDKVSDEDTP